MRRKDASPALPQPPPWFDRFVAARWARSEDCGDEREAFARWSAAKVDWEMANDVSTLDRLRGERAARLRLAGRTMEL